MTTRYKAFLSVFVLIASCSSTHAATVPTPLKAVALSATVGSNDRNGLFTYRYRVTNPGINDGAIRSLTVELTRTPGDLTLNREGLTNGAGYMTFGSADTFARVPTVPVGITGPDGWLLSLSVGGRPTSRSFARWGSPDALLNVAPGRNQDGYQLVSYGLPGIRKAEIQRAIDFDSLPDEYYDDPDLAIALQENLVFHTKTVGPKAPPATFVPLDFLDYLIALLHDSRQNGWVKVEGVHRSLLAKLLAAKRALEASRVEPASGELGAFAREVEAVSCLDFRCPGNRALSSEAFALLYYNARYLLDRLPVVGR